VSLAEILDEIPKLTFTERQELVRQAIAIDDDALTPEENAILDARMEAFHLNPEAGLPLEQLGNHVRKRLPRK
jgi:putative addiction module component (TIGR02574 family)